MNKKMLFLQLALLCFLVLPAVAQEASTTWSNRHHIGLVLGYVKLTGDNLKDDFQGYDFSNTGHAALTYRYSFNSKLDLSIEGRAFASTQTTSNGAELTITDGFFGPGLRINFPKDKGKTFRSRKSLFRDRRRRFKRRKLF